MVLSYAHKFDLIWITEIKTGWKISVPGFIVYQNTDKENCHRGGIALLVKSYLQDQIEQVDLG